MDPLNPPAIHGEVVAGRSATVRKQLIMLVGNIKQNTFDLMDLLMEAKANNYPAQWGFVSVTDYGVQELGLKERKTQYLIRIGEVCKAVGLKRADYETAGISKLRDICTLDPEGSWFNPDTKTNEPLDEWIVGLITDAENVILPLVRNEGYSPALESFVRDHHIDIVFPVIAVILPPRSDTARTPNRRAYPPRDTCGQRADHSVSRLYRKRRIRTPTSR